jgi:flavin-binding protein dodecin
MQRLTSTVVRVAPNGYRETTRPARIAPGRVHPSSSEPIDEEKAMAKAQPAEGVYRVIDVVGSSDTSWEDAARNAVETAGKSLRDMRIAEVMKLDVKIEDGKVLAYRTRLQLSFKYEG